MNYCIICGKPGGIWEYPCGNQEKYHGNPSLIREMAAVEQISDPHSGIIYLVVDESVATALHGKKVVRIPPHYEIKLVG